MRVSKAGIDLRCGWGVGGWPFLLPLLAVGVAAPAWAAPLPLSKEEQAKVDKAIDKAIAFLKHAQSKKGDWPHQYPDYRVGANALPPLALLEAEVPKDDPVVQRAAEWMRPRLADLDKTYELSLALLFLDRLGDPRDEPAIRSLALRLIAGQCRSGGWCYRCPTLSPTNEKILPDLLRQWEEAAANQKAPPTVPRDFKVLTVFQDPAKLAAWQDPPNGPLTVNQLFTGSTDNSNTQFAILALWAARRHGLALGPTLRLVARRFENSQNPDGTWSYRPMHPKSPGALRVNTTVGLLGLALRDGLRPGKEPLPAVPDEQVLRGLVAVSLDIGSPTGQMRQRVPLTNPYYLWSLERLAMLYDLPTIGGKDWYRWGAEMLVTNQTHRGDWPHGEWIPIEMATNHGPALNTAFPLLFLKRSHLLPDLTTKLPYKPGVLEKGIAATLQGGRLPAAAARFGPPAAPDQPVTTSKKR